MIKLDQAIGIHQILIEKFGGSSGIKDQGALEAALNRPFATFDQKDLYPTAVEKAAAILESILINHPFVDGNKRTGYVLMRLILMDGGLDIHASQREKYEFVIQVTEGKLDISQIKEWISSHLKK
ncbi:MULTISPECIES: type II toxin-antitoxin system death-on-curing family toxin [unclassified Robiginitalea]|uniref:type II toxin-antitoxin system death-on-curing family toxin n=1 Tax=Robiginitalea TaxID=252306 RepID=UPI00234A3DEB|nr:MULTISPECIES: type II toxin-antitoxin system death-on-curing family toxin [unclassified Robiginitalea]MDC6355097.1 type II toxin-antitoxin system death-on-curing family toxin [Robiginitalea sp. PM2]MDC6375688.1 type II toxin-antitoxin system death-on-curing family toxin [Robiginitalea sp. SP8]